MPPLKEKELGWGQVYFVVIIIKEIKKEGEASVIRYHKSRKVWCQALTIDVRAWLRGHIPFFVILREQGGAPGK